MKHPHMTSLTLAIALGSIAFNSFAADDWDESAWEDAGWDDGAAIDEEKTPWTFNGFAEAALGGRLQDNNAISNDATLAETRFQVDTRYQWKTITASLIGDLYADDVTSKVSGAWREANITWPIHASTDLKIGRQILTWGTGDLLFLNDLFPKDWQSFFAGRDTAYLKSPSDAIKASLYHSVNIDLVWTPRFDSDNYLSGDRFSYFSPMLGETTAAPNRIRPQQRDHIGQDSEWAMRIYKNVEGLELAAYLYDGYFKSPVGIDSQTMQPYFPKLSSIGASIRGSLFQGIANTEFAYYNSKEDSDGTNPFVPNDQLRWLIGYEQELVTNLTLGLQWYLEWIQDYDKQIAHSPFAQYEPEERRHVVTTRLTYRLWQDKLTLSLFGFYSPTDKDAFVLPSVSYRASDQWSFTVGANLFGGQEEHTFFGQFEDNSNLYIRARYIF